MTFLTPSIAAIAAAIAVPTLVILYFLKLRRRDMEISTTLLWKKAIQDMQANAPFQRLRRNILLLLQLLVLGAALLALAQPQSRMESSTGEKRILLIDRSASMQAQDEDDGKGGKRSRLDAAKEQAKAFIETMREPTLFDKSSADEAMVIVFDTTAEVRQQFTSDKRLLREAIDAIDTSDGPTSIGEAMRLAKAQAPTRKAVKESDGTLRMIEGLQGGDPVSMHLWSDGRLPDSAEAMPGVEDKFTFHRVGTAGAPNVAIVGVRADRAFDNPQRLAIYVALESSARDRRSVDVELEIDGQIRGIQPITFEPARPAEGTTASPDAEGAGPQPRAIPQTGGVVFPIDRPEGGVATIRIRPATPDAAQPADVLPMDDAAYLIIPPAKKLAVAVVTKGNLFLSTALGGLPLARLDTLTPDEFQSRARQEKLGEYDVLVLDGVLPPAGVTPALAVNPATGLPPGRYMVLNAVPGPALIDQGRGDSTAVIDWVRDHPTMRNITLDNLVIAQARNVQIAPGTGGKAIATAGNGPAVVELAAADSRAIVIPFDVAESTWPFDVSFVVFLAQGVNYLGSDAAAIGGGDSRLVQPGGVLSDRLPVGIPEAELITPQDRRVTLTPASDGRVVYAPIRRSGVYSVSWSGPAGAGDEVAGGRPVRRYAANLLDGFESDVAVDDQLVLANQVVKATARTGEGMRKLWPYFLLGALVIMLLEWFIYNRKVHV
jgi:hypothetical protein